jgi:hypothetical protein
MQVRNLQKEFGKSKTNGEPSGKARGSELIKKVIDVALNISLVLAILLHLAYRTGLFFANPVSERLQGMNTFLWFAFTSAIWLAWKKRKLLKEFVKSQTIDELSGKAKGSELIKGAIDVALNISLFLALVLHLASRTGLFFTNPVAERLQGMHTFLWFAFTFAVWLAWKKLTGRISKSKRPS